MTLNIGKGTIQSYFWRTVNLLATMSREYSASGFYLDAKIITLVILVLDYYIYMKGLLYSVAFTMTFRNMSILWP